MTRILVIDDDDQVREMLRQTLEREGYEVVEAEDGNAGIKAYRRQPTDLIITDLIMPNKEGMETIMELRRDFPGVKIIAISGGGRMGPEFYLPAAKSLGAQKTMTKPVDRKELLEAIQGLLHS